MTGTWCAEGVLHLESIPFGRCVRVDLERLSCFMGSSKKDRGSDKRGEGKSRHRHRDDSDDDDKASMFLIVCSCTFFCTKAPDYVS